MKPELKRVLFIALDHLGDNLRYTPILRTLRKVYPEAYIAVLSAEAQGDVFRHFKDIDDLILLPHAAIREQLQEGSDLVKIVKEFLYDLIQSMKRQQYDLVINPFNEIGAMIALLVKPKKILGRAMLGWDQYQVFGENAARFYFLMSKQNELRVHATKPFHESAIEILKDLAISEDEFELETKLTLGLHDRQFADDFFKRNNITDNDTVIAFQMGALLDQRRMWPGEKFARLANMLWQKYDYRLILLGSPKDRRKYLQEVLPHLKKKAVLAVGETTLLQSAAIMEKSDLLVTVDTGPMHMAAALEVPIAALFGLKTCIPCEARPATEKVEVLMADITDHILVEDVFVKCDILLSLLQNPLIMN